MGVSPSFAFLFVNLLSMPALSASPTLGWRCQGQTQGTVSYAASLRASGWCKERSELHGSSRLRQLNSIFCLNSEMWWKTCSFLEILEVLHTALNCYLKPIALQRDVLDTLYLLKILEVLHTVLNCYLKPLSLYRDVADNLYLLITVRNLLLYPELLSEIYLRATSSTRFLEFFSRDHHTITFDHNSPLTDSSDRLNCAGSSCDIFCDSIPQVRNWATTLQADWLTSTNRLSQKFKTYYIYLILSLVVLIMFRTL